MGPIGCPETSLRNFHYSLRNSPEERSSDLLRGGSLKSRVFKHATVFLCQWRSDDSGQFVCLLSNKKTAFPIHFINVFLLASVHIKQF